MRLRVVAHLLDHGIDVLMNDIDAYWVQASDLLAI